MCSRHVDFYPNGPSIKTFSLKANIYSPLNEEMLSINDIVLLAILFHQHTCSSEIMPRKSGEKVVCHLQVEAAMYPFDVLIANDVHCRTKLTRGE